MPATVVSLLPTSGVLGMLALLGACIWILMDPQDRLRPRVFLFIAAIPLYGYFCSRVLQAENATLPVKFDFVLFHIDEALGVSSAAVARAFHVGPMVAILCEFYRSLLVAMAVAYALNLKDLKSPSILWAFGAELLVGPALYALLPACGPIYAFRDYPWHGVRPAFAASVLSGDPNAVPSLHMATALILVLFARKRRSRAVFLLYAAAIAVSTLITGEHYVIDLIVAVPFACFAGAVAQRRAGRAAGYLGVVLAWMIAIRVIPGVLVLHSAILRIIVGVTIAAGVHGVVLFWRGMGTQLEGGDAIEDASSGIPVLADSERAG